MAHLPPGGAAETVTTTDLGSDIAAVRTELYRVVSDQTRTMVLALVASNATLAALAFGAARLT